MKPPSGLKGTPLKPGKPPQRKTPLAPGRPIARSAAASTPAAKAVAAARRMPRRETGFSAVAKLAIRTRAGNGDPGNAMCEATGVWLGRYGGEIQHRNARRAGGSRLRNNIANGVLLSREAHRLAEARDEHMHAAGFWLLSTQDSRQEPIMLQCQNGGLRVWLTDDSRYSLTPPEGGQE